MIKGDKVMKLGDNFRLLSFPRNPRNDLACLDLWTTLALSGNQFVEKISSDKIDFLHPLCAAEKCRKWKKCCSKPNWLSPIPLLLILCNIGSYQISASTLKMECTKEIENHFGNASYIRETHTGGNSKEPTQRGEIVKTIKPTFVWSEEFSSSSVPTLWLLLPYQVSFKHISSA